MRKGPHSVNRRVFSHKEGNEKKTSFIVSRPAPGNARQEQMGGVDDLGDRRTASDAVTGACGKRRAMLGVRSSFWRMPFMEKKALSQATS